MQADQATALPVRDPVGFAAFCQQHVDAVPGFVTRHTDSPHPAADLTAGIFLTVLEQAHACDARRGAPAAWLFGISRKVLAAPSRGSAREWRAAARIAGRRLLDEAGHASPALSATRPAGPARSAVGRRVGPVAGPGQVPWLSPSRTRQWCDPEVGARVPSWIGIARSGVVGHPVRRLCEPVPVPAPVPAQGTNCRTVRSVRQ